MAINNNGSTTVINATYRVVTPMYIGGANQSPEFRLSSYAHQLRWWWRFLALERFGGEHDATFWEALLFGWHKKPFGRKRVSFRLISLNSNGKLQEWGSAKDWRGKRNGLSYLTAKGFDNRKAAPVEEFQIEARVKSLDIESLKTDIESLTTPMKDQTSRVSTDFAVALENWRLAIQTLIDAISVFGLLGGMGARSRRGFGSLTIASLSVSWPVDTTVNQQRHETVISDIPEDVAGYRRLIRHHLNGAATAKQSLRAVRLPAYSAYSDQLDYRICVTGEGARTLMNDIGWAFQIYRSWGAKPKRESEHYHIFFQGKKLEAGKKKLWYKQKFKDDHNEFYLKKLKKNNNNEKEIFDNRAIFGLPHNYGKNQVGWCSKEAGSHDSTAAHNRRASPLLFHFHQLKNGQTVFVATVIKARFAPQDARLSVKGRICNNLEFDCKTLDWTLLNDFSTFLTSPDKSVKREDSQGVKYTSYEVIPEE